MSLVLKVNCTQKNGGCFFHHSSQIITHQKKKYVWRYFNRKHRNA